MLTQESESSDESSDDEDEEEYTLKMALLNPRSAKKFVRGKDDRLSTLIWRNELDVLLLTETWLSEESQDAFESILPPNYRFLSNPRPDGQGGGVAIVYSNALRCEQVEFDLNLQCEYVAASFSYSRSLEPILIISIYHPPSASDTEFLKELKSILQEALARYRFVVIGGDFNIWFDQKDLNSTRRLRKLLEKNKIAQFVSQSTHKDGHILDLVIANDKVKIRRLSVRSNSFSDHKTVFFTARYTPQYIRK
ncbi:hypothetical protein WMY93_012918 [Mugilogobius chulae]|uniref:Endonuclease/exonuclease/phosphatase domain-containing protein n=1 Tax=Mugilogobius chulae TaxID=88201 RepID=A0AAW0P7N1_9GOBI